jgi:hypothetical protein
MQLVTTHTHINNTNNNAHQASKYLGEWIEAQYSGLASLTMTPLSKALRGYTQESARHAIESKTVGYLAELRRVTTIFINISGLEEHLLQGALFYVQQVRVRVTHSLQCACV